MRKRHLILAGLAVTVVLVLAILVVACGSSNSTTSTEAATTASSGPATTVATATTGTSGSASTTSTIPTPTTGQIDPVRLYGGNCSGCHSSVPKATVAEVKAVLESGKGDMPSFKGRLQATEIDAIAAYVAAGGK